MAASADSPAGPVLTADWLEDALWLAVAGLYCTGWHASAGAAAAGAGPVDGALAPADDAAGRTARSTAQGPVV